MNKIRKHFFFGVVTCLLGVLLWVCAFYWEYNSEVVFRVNGASGTEEIRLYDAGDGNCYLFLPSYAELEKVYLASDPGEGLVIGSVTMHEGTSCSGLELEQTYPLAIGGEDRGTIRLLRSANVATIYINTATGSMERIHRDKDYRETISLITYDVRGRLDYQSDAATMKGRGNSTWSSFEKKPYKLDLSAASELLGMEAGTEWILLANALDPTNLRNKLVYDFARDHGPYPGFAADSRFADLYLNGEYAGLYLLTEKMDVAENRLEIDPGSFFFEMLYPDRVLESDAAFLVNETRAIKVNYPGGCSGEQLSQLQSHVIRMQEAIYSDETRSESATQWDDYIDVDSWARKLLVEELFVNLSVGQNSQLFWWTPGEHAVFAGPCWDYDLALGMLWGTSWTTPYCMLSQRYWGETPSWYAALWEKPEFCSYVRALFENEFLPAFRVLICEEVPKNGAIITSSSFMDYLRWPQLYGERPGTEMWDAMAEYLAEHAAFLEDIWINGSRYCSITLIPGDTFNLYVPYGADGEAVPEPGDFQLGQVSNWVHRETGEVFAPEKPITESLVLIPEPVSGDQRVSAGGFALRDYITAASLLAFLMVLSAFVCVDIRQRRKEKSVINETRTHVSP